MKPESLYCKVFVDGASTREDLIASIASRLGGVVRGNTIATKHLELDVVENDDHDKRVRRQDPAGFLHFRWFFDVEQTPEAARADFIRQLTDVILHLRRSGLDAVAACAFEDELPPPPARVS